MKALPWLAAWALATAGLLGWFYTEGRFAEAEQLEMAVGGSVIAGIAVLLFRLAVK